jgi:hypothetical protein
MEPPVEISAPAPEPAYAASAVVEPPAIEEPEEELDEPELEDAPLVMSAAAQGAASARDAFDDLDVPAILRRDRRMIQ